MAHVADVDGFESDGGNETNSDFQSACDVVTSLAGSLSQQRLLQLYGLYKQATEGPCSAPKPGLLHWACDRGHLNLVEFLVLNGGCDVNIRDRDGSTPLHYAATIGNAEVVELLLTKLGADPSIKDEEGLTALDAADSKTVKDLISEALKSVS
ncbi:unnamed protein product [Cyprideis torosa]|uniref:Acyl-CoA-binding domain-containing protein 6 n=1 Tax=Cyprideis torosa TaxID=163714 RepID=A0A7R8WC96_9CRUS|nr:unnamed protein product [Cyprideis torosa]CAG0893150.1 unnamed protein product [Cyprideis torosa]